MACRLDQAVVLGRGINTLYIGEAVAFHLSDQVYDGRRADAVRMRYTLAVPKGTPEPVRQKLRGH